MTSSRGRVRVGCCGFRSSREAYYELLDSVEVQHTFYQPPQGSTLRRWGEEAPAGFEFALKAWQLVTHLPSSPTYRRLKRPLTEEQREGAGFFRPTEAVQNAWEVTRECGRPLAARGGACKAAEGGRARAAWLVGGRPPPLPRPASLHPGADNRPPLTTGGRI